MHIVKIFEMRYPILLCKNPWFVFKAQKIEVKYQSNQWRDDTFLNHKSYVAFYGKLINKRAAPDIWLKLYFSKRRKNWGYLDLSFF